MQHFELNGQTRKAAGKAALKAFRAQGLVPCNLYGAGVENVLFTIDAKALKAVTDTPKAHIIDLVLDGSKKYTAVLHELQWHPVTDSCLHVDFLAVNETKPINIEVPIVITGHAVGVQQGGKFYQNARKIRICATMDKLPDEVTVDITSLGLDKRIKAGDVKMEGITITTDKDAIICGVKTTRNTVVATEEA
ncbi:MAG: 50S ribosomal protein L25 [Bacteroidales bacterium]|jgi:large subunit ribosomal protein L25|nr:50S ribosomal protein L25 [Bacteroidales bacterium]MBR0028950.1 50S ribosomal protein L25 [Bacteroidales bacterium]MBR0082634.1 50S ribosomal protein L25 [Bacteroidales bacterium]